MDEPLKKKNKQEVETGSPYRDKNLPVCEHGFDCGHTDLIHFAEYFHPCSNDNINLSICTTSSTPLKDDGSIEKYSENDGDILYDRDKYFDGADLDDRDKPYGGDNTIDKLYGRAKFYDGDKPYDGDNMEINVPPCQSSSENVRIDAIVQSPAAQSFPEIRSASEQVCSNNNLKDVPSFVSVKNIAVDSSTKYKPDKTKPVSIPTPNLNANLIEAVQPIKKILGENDPPLNSSLSHDHVVPRGNNNGAADVDNDIVVPLNIKGSACSAFTKINPPSKESLVSINAPLLDSGAFTKTKLTLSKHLHHLQSSDDNCKSVDSDLDPTASEITADECDSIEDDNGNDDDDDDDDKCPNIVRISQDLKTVPAKENSSDFDSECNVNAKDVVDCNSQITDQQLTDQLIHSNSKEILIDSSNTSKTSGNVIVEGILVSQRQIDEHEICSSDLDPTASAFDSQEEEKNNKIVSNKKTLFSETDSQRDITNYSCVSEHATDQNRLNNDGKEYQSSSTSKPLFSARLNLVQPCTEKMSSSISLTADALSKTNTVKSSNVVTINIKLQETDQSHSQPMTNKSPSHLIIETPASQPLLTEKTPNHLSSEALSSLDPVNDNSTQLTAEESLSQEESAPTKHVIEIHSTDDDDCMFETQEISCDDGWDNVDGEVNECQLVKQDTNTVLVRGPSIVKSYSLLTDAERKELIRKAFEVKTKLQGELKQSNEALNIKIKELSDLQMKLESNHLFVEGEKEALDGIRMRLFPLFAERKFKEGSAEQLHFRIAESQFYRLLSSSMCAFKVTKVEYVVNPALVSRFQIARKNLSQHRSLDESYPVLGFHGTNVSNIISICSDGFRVPGEDSFKHASDPGWYGAGVYFSEYPAYSMPYIRGSTKILLSQILPGKIFQCKHVQLGDRLREGYDSHISPNGKEIVIFNSHRILPCYIVYYERMDGDFEYEVRK